MLNLLSITIPRYLVWVVSVGPSSAGHEVAFHSDGFFLKIMTSVLLVLNMKQLVFIQLATSVMQAMNLFRVLGVLSESKRMS